jgi:hypothetical protein
MLIVFSRLILPAAVTAIIAAATPAPPATYSVSPVDCWNTAVWQSVWIVKRVCRPDAPAPAQSAPAPAPPPDAPAPPPDAPAEP